MFTGIVGVGPSPLFLEPLHVLGLIPYSLVISSGYATGENPTDYIRSWQMTLTNLGTDFNTDAANFTAAVYYGPWQMCQSSVNSSNVWNFGTKLAAGDSVTLTGVGESVYVLIDPAATSPDDNADVFVASQWT